MTNYEHLDSLYPSQCQKLVKFRELLASIPQPWGDFAEFGCYNGGGARELAQLAPPSTTVWAFDTWEGMPESEYHPEEDSSDPPGKWKPLADPAKLFEGLGNISVMQGLFRDTLSEVPLSTHFSLVHIDCDYYNSYQQVLAFLDSRFTPGAVAVVDDYGCAGARRAIDEFVKTHNVDWNGVDLLRWK